MAAFLLALTGAVLLVYVRVGSEAARADRLAAEADLRGDAVATLAGDVRALRAQVSSQGGTPVAPDPTKAVADLPERSQVPVVVTGPSGAAGAAGRDGKDGAPGASGAPGAAGSPGASGAPGTDGAAGAAGPAGPAGPAGKDGADGADGKDGTDGRDGADGQTCPDGYSLQAPDWDADALVCRKTATPDPSPSPTPEPTESLLVASALITGRRRFA